MNERQLLEAAVRGIENPVPKEDQRSFIVRLLSSIKVKIKLGKKIDHPIEKISIEGGTDF